MSCSSGCASAPRRARAALPPRRAPTDRRRGGGAIARLWPPAALCSRRGPRLLEEILMKPETVGLSSARLARLDEVMRRKYVDGGYLPGLLTYVYRKGEIVHTSLCGQMDLERGRKMREDAIFRIYSMSKPITAVALMML